MSEALEVPLELEVGQVVWAYFKSWKWWPCEVVSRTARGKLTVLSFGDSVNKNFDPKHIKPWHCNEHLDFKKDGESFGKMSDRNLFQTAFKAAEMAHKKRQHKSSESQMSPGRRGRSSGVQSCAESTPTSSTLDSDPMCHREACSDSPAAKRRLRSRESQSSQLLPIGPRSSNGTQAASPDAKHHRREKKSLEKQPQAEVSQCKKVPESIHNSRSTARPASARAASKQVTEKMNEKKKLSSSPPNGRLKVNGEVHLEPAASDRLSDSSDDELSQSALAPQTTPSRLSQYKRKDIVWVKYGREPFWPALVRRVEKGFIRVVFLGMGTTIFGHDTDLEDDLNRRNIKYMSFKIKKARNVVPFYVDTENYKRKGEAHCSDEAKKTFNKAYHLAMDILCRSLPQASSSNESNATETSLTSGSSELVETIFEDGEDHMNESDMSEVEEKDQLSVDEPSETEDDEFDERFNSLEKIKSYVDELKDVLLDIYYGRVASERHTLALQGSHVQQRSQKRCGTFGPVKIPVLQFKLANLLIELFERIPDEQKIQILSTTYVFDVWIPELIIRIIAKIDGIPFTEAEQRFLFPSMST